jgi:predicted ATPase
MARLDRLGPTKEVAQLGAVIGREFPHELLAALSPLDDAALEAAVAQLADAELLYRRGLPPRAVYTFKHALIQDTAYQSLLKSKRQHYHARIAKTLADSFPERAASEPEVVARHYEEARFFPEAIAWYQRAGERASQRSANAESVGHLTKAIALLETLPETPERKQRELVLQVALGAPLLVLKGYGGAEVERAYGRAHDLCREIGEAPQLFQALWGLSVFYQARNELGTALELGAQLLGLAEGTGEPSLLIMAHMSLGSPYYWKGEWTKSLQHVEQAIALYDPSKHRPLAYVYGEDPGVSSRIYAAQALWQLGFPDRALQRITEGVDLAREGAHPFSLGYALSFAAGIHVLRREPEPARKRAAESIAVSREQDLSLWLGLGTVLHGWALARAEAGGEGLEELQEGVTLLMNTGTEVGAPYLFTYLAEAYADAGRIEDAQSALDNSLALAALKQSPYWDAEMHRLKGEFLLKQDRSAEQEAEALFRRALELAREQKARSLALRAALSLCRLQRRQGKRKDARALLAGIYGAFTEGFETGDLKDARALLDELS